MKRVLAVLVCLVCILSACKPNAAAPTPTAPTATNEALKALYGNGTSANLLVAADEFGREVLPVGERRQNRDLGIFYWLWHGETGQDQVYDSSKILAMENGLDILLYQDSPLSPAGKHHYWGEPLYGYYHSGDEYIIRRHLELLTYAGVDFLVFDVSNTITYKDVYQKIMQIICEMREEGWDAPQVTFYTHTCSIDTIKRLYSETYKKGLYKEAWYCIEGKPLMIGFTDVEYDKARTRSQHSHLANYNPRPLSDEILNFFHFRRTAWIGCDPVTPDGWPWLEQVFPQQLYGNLMCVAVASHLGYYFPTSLIGGATNWGRGWSFKTNSNSTERAPKGSFFQEQWDNALKKDPELIFVSGWNEWFCAKTYVDAVKMYVVGDSVNMEFSRDAEMMKGGYNDAFLIQMALNIRKYKYAPLQGDFTSPNRTIDINGDISQWQGVEAIYRPVDETAKGRDHAGTVQALHYYVEAPKNNPVEIKVAKDEKNIYFYIRCEKDITAPLDDNWMNLFIGTDAKKGWNGYEYVINRSVKGGVSDIQKLNADFTAEKVGQARLSINKNVLQLAIPRSVLGLVGENCPFYFKIADSVVNPEDIMDYYVTGKSVPMGRWSYQYFG